MNLRESAAALVLGILPPERLPEVAVSALESGLDSPSLATLAGTPGRADPEELRSLFADALRELALPLPSQLESARILKCHYAAQVAARELAPRKGAALIVERVFRQVDDLLTRGAYLGESFGIAQLVGLYYNYDDVPVTDQTSIAEIDEAIVEECERIANEAGGLTSR
jgi:hypothetical protein